MTSRGKTFIVGSAKKGTGTSKVARDAAARAEVRIQKHKAEIAGRPRRQR